VSSRKEQKEALRREREERERAAKEVERRRRLIGYGAAGALGLAAAVVVVLLVAGGDGGGHSDPGKGVLPDGGKVPPQKESDLTAAATAAGCKLQSFPATSRVHLANPDQKVKYSSNPPTSGKHYQVPAEDGAYDQAPPDTALVHTLEHGRVIVWFKPSLPASERANLKKFFDDDNYHMVIVPRANMPYDVAASAWNADPQPNGTGRLLACPRYSDKVFDALRAFREEHRDNGPEVVG
jgi:uncharacterized protein DUF3105